MVPPLAAVSAIVIVIVLLLVLNRPDNSVSAGPVVTPRPSTTTAEPELTAPPVTASPTPTPTPTPTPSRSPKPHRTLPSAEPSATAKPAVAKIPVTVLNNSRRQGLAHRAAAQVSSKGWPIKQIGNFTGRIRVSTAYYAPGQAEEAHLLARDFPAIQRVLPRFDGLPGSGLTLVVTREWPA